MALFDIFKKRKKYVHDDRFREKAKESTRKKEETRKEIHADTYTPAIKEESHQEKFASNRASIILHSPVITERSTLLAEHGSYVFHVAERATKSEIKRAVEELYHMSVIGVRTLYTKSKQRRMRGVKGIKSGYKKAIVTIEKGKKIEFV